MGILDDAIREHLDLKRRHGAQDTELARLEDEAFGPPSRPGEPDFPDTGAEAVVSEAPPAELESPPAEIGAPPEAVEEPVAEALPDPEPVAVEPDPEPVAVEAQAPEPEPPPEPQPEPPPPPEAPAGGFFDQDALDPPPEPEPPAPEPVPQAEAPPPAIEEPPPIESLDTVEHPFEGAITDTGESTPVEPPPVFEDTGEAEVVQGEFADTGEAEVVQGELTEEHELPATGEQDQVDDAEDEDVLEETPEFLRDAPEDDELWFEQGEPKDFDF